MLWINGYTIEIIAREVGASVGSVRNIVQELRERRYPDFKNYVAYLEDLRRLSQQLRARKHTLQEALTGLAVYEGLTDLGLDPGGLQEQIQLFERTAPSDFPADQFARSALRVSKLESETGMTYEQLETRAIELKSDIARDESRKKELTNSINSLRTAEEDSRQSLERRLAQNKVTEQGLQSFLRERDMLQKVGLGPGNLKLVADLVSKCGTGEILAAAKELSALESKTGVNIQGLVADCKRMVELREQAVSEYNVARGMIQKSQGELQQMQQARKDQLARNNITDSQLAIFLTTRQQLTAWGIPLDKLESLKRVLGELEKQDFLPDKVAFYLRSIQGLEERKQQLSAEVAAVKNELDSKKRELQKINDRVSEKQSVLLKLHAAEAEGTAILTGTELGISHNLDRVEFAETFVRLCETGNANNEQIARMIQTLQQVLKTRETVHGLPIDYDRIRKEFMVLVEKVLGDRLLPSGRLDEERRKMRGFWDFLESRKKEIDQERTELDNATTDKLLAMVVSLHRKGAVFSGQCSNCKTRVAVRKGNAPRFFDIYSCPSCLGNLKLSNIPLPQLNLIPPKENKRLAT